MKMILATDINGGIGYNGGLPWPHIKEDMEWFKEHTVLKNVVMGRTTWESIGSKPLPRRKNIIISTTMTQDDIFEARCLGEVELFNSIDEFLLNYRNDSGMVVMGGKTIYQALAPYCDEILQTVIVGLKYPTDVSIDIKDLTGGDKWVRTIEKVVNTEVGGRRVSLDFVSHRRLPKSQSVLISQPATARHCSLGDFHNVYPEGKVISSDKLPLSKEGVAVTFYGDSELEYTVWFTKQYYDFLPVELIGNVDVSVTAELKVTPCEN